MMLAKGWGVSEVLVGVFGVVMFVMGAALAVDTALTSDPGAMDTGFGQLFAVALILGSTAALWWSLDPDGDGRANANAPVLRLLRDMGWSERDVSMFDTDGDLVVDQLEWRPTPGPTDAQTWCVAVSIRGALFAAHWSEAAPRQCHGLSSSRVLP